MRRLLRVSVTVEAVLFVRLNRLKSTTATPHWSAFRVKLTPCTLFGKCVVDKPNRTDGWPATDTGTCPAANLSPLRFVNPINGRSLLPDINGLAWPDRYIRRSNGQTSQQRLNLPMHSRTPRAQWQLSLIQEYFCCVQSSKMTYNDLVESLAHALPHFFLSVFHRSAEIMWMATFVML